MKFCYWLLININIDIWLKLVLPWTLQMRAIVISNCKGEQGATSCSQPSHPDSLSPHLMLLLKKWNHTAEFLNHFKVLNHSLERYVPDNLPVFCSNTLVWSLHSLILKPISAEASFNLSSELIFLESYFIIP